MVGFIRSSALFLVSSLLVTSILASESSEGSEPDPKILINELNRQSNQTLLWGPYRPQVYFGLKPRIPNGMITGLMWSKVNEFTDFQNHIRHTCEQRDDMLGYGWEEYDPRTGGKQVMYDQKNMLDITTEFVKVEGGEHGGSWGARIKGTLREDAPKDHKSTVFFYLGTHDSKSIKLKNQPDEKGLTGVVELEGNEPGLGKFNIQVTRGPESNKPPTLVNKEEWESRPLDRTMYFTSNTLADDPWKAQTYLVGNLQKNFMKLQEKYGENHPPPWQSFVVDNGFAKEGQIHMIQKVFEGSWEFDVLFSSGSAPEPMTSELLTQKIKENHEAFQMRFGKLVKLEAPFDTPEHKKFVQNFYSNLLGGIGHFYGNAKVDRSYADEYAEEDENFWEAAAEARSRPGVVKDEGPYELFSSVPSRPFFPRGFLWDEGFHLLLISDWDTDLALQIIKSWVNLADSDGWIAREQILGEEARSKVPEEFQVQFPHYANPPTLYFTLVKFLFKAQSYQFMMDPISMEDSPLENIRMGHVHNEEAAIQYLKDVYPILKRNYYWFRDAQRGEVKAYDRKAFSSKEAYRWRGRTPDHCLTSGLDDYPRAQPPHPGELHVDLLSWTGQMLNGLNHMASMIGEEDDMKEYQKQGMAIARNLEDLHWNEKEGIYCDATIDEYEEHKHVCHKGYVSLLPFLFGFVLHDDSRLERYLDMIEDPEQLWSDYGLRSLSKQDPFYGTGENYWRGPIWININYLAVIRLADLGSHEGFQQARAAKMYENLRKNLVNNVYKQWKETGYAWEQYNPDTGKGQRTAHFLGWTSLIIEIIRLPEKVGEHIPPYEPPKKTEEAEPEASMAEGDHTYDKKSAEDDYTTYPEEKDAGLHDHSHGGDEHGHDHSHDGDEDDGQAQCGGGEDEEIFKHDEL